MRPKKQDSSGLLIALSAGGKNEELAAQGLGTEHIEELMVRVAMRLLKDGHRLAFGGTLGNPDQPLTQFLIDTAQSWLDEESARQSDVTRPETWPLANYSAWPFHTIISEEQRAQMVGICRFVSVDPSGVAKADLDAAVENWHDNPQARLFAADGLSTMREQSAREADLRIVWGGRIAGATGWMAGILEEVAFSLEYEKPVLVLGGFGGCARLLAGFLADENAPWPAQLTLAACADPERDGLLTDSERNSLDERLEQAKTRLMEFRSRLSSNDTVNGVSAELIRDALLEETARRVISHSATAAKQCLVS